MSEAKKSSTPPPCYGNEGKAPGFCRPDTDKLAELNIRFGALQDEVVREVFRVIPDAKNEIRRTVAVKALPLCWNDGMNATAGVREAISLCKNKTRIK